MIWITLILIVMIIIFLLGNYFAKKSFKEKGREEPDDIYPLY
jgi:uncharacterized protein YneF (UPF0154 family)